MRRRLLRECGPFGGSGLSVRRPVEWACPRGPGSVWPLPLHRPRPSPTLLQTGLGLYLEATGVLSAHLCALSTPPVTQGNTCPIMPLPTPTITTRDFLCTGMVQLEGEGRPSRDRPVHPPLCINQISLQQTRIIIQFINHRTIPLHIITTTSRPGSCGDPRTQQL